MIQCKLLIHLCAAIHVVCNICNVQGWMDGWYLTLTTLYMALTTLLLTQR